MAKCLMLDVDGVLVDGRPSDGRRWDHEMFEDMGILSHALGEAFFKAEWGDIVVGRKDLLPTLSDVLKQMASTVQAQELVDYWFKMDSRLVEAVLSDCRAARLQGIPVYLATNQEHLRATYLMETMGLRDEVDGIAYSAKAGYKKPQREFFSYAVRVTGFLPDEMLLIDDTMLNVEAAREAGWQAVHWDGGEKVSDIVRRIIR